MKTITYTLAADRFLSKIQPQDRVWIEGKVERYALTGEGDVKAMTGSPTFRLRVGPFRVIFTETLVVLDVLDVGHRSNI